MTVEDRGGRTGDGVSTPTTDDAQLQWEEEAGRVIGQVMGSPVTVGHVVSADPSDDLPARLALSADAFDENRGRDLWVITDETRLPDDLRSAASCIRELTTRLDAAHEAIRYLHDNDGYAPDYGSNGAWVDEFDAAVEENR